MSGLENDVFVMKNVNFDYTAIPPHNGIVTANGQLLIGSTANPNIAMVANTLTPGSGVTITNGPGSITIAATGSSTNIASIGVQTGTNPVVPDAGGLVTFNGTTVAAGTNPVRTDGTAPNTMALEVQISQAVASTTAANNGLSHFDSGDFTVDANGFVSLAGGGAAQTITGDSGGPLSPTTGNWNIIGGPGVTTSGSGSTLTINSVVFTDQGISTSVTSNSGSFATAAITLTLPAAPAQGEVCEFVATSAAVLVVDAPSTHLIRIANAITSAGGTASSSGLAGDSLSLRYRASDTTWYATSVIGVWQTA